MGGGGVWKLPAPRKKGPPYFSRNQIATAMHQIGVLLELSGANPFRTRSYFNGSRTISTLNEDLGEIVASGRLMELNPKIYVVVEPITPKYIQRDAITHSWICIIGISKSYLSPVFTAASGVLVWCPSKAVCTATNSTSSAPLYRRMSSLSVGKPREWQPGHHDWKQYRYTTLPE